jgi:eukaryotic-like serine/threonine-protein kinase
MTGRENSLVPVFEERHTDNIEKLFDPRDAHEHYFFSPHDKLAASSTCYIFRGVDKQTNKHVAIKFALPKTERPERRAYIQTRAIKELELSWNILHGINSPYILTPIDVVKDDTLGIGLVTPWADGETIAQHIDDIQKNSWESGASYGIQIALGLAALHEAHIVFRDLKPENIFIADKDQFTFARCMIGDFGISVPTSYLNINNTNTEHTAQKIEHAIEAQNLDTIWDERYTPIGRTIGTPQYQSPEQVQGKHLTYTSDFFTLGMVLYEIISGDHPFISNTSLADTDKLKIKKNITQNPTPPFPFIQTSYTEQARTMKYIINQLLEKEPTLRTHATIIQSGQHKKINLSTARHIAKALAECWQGSGSPIEQTPWFKEALGTQPKK